MKDPTQRFSDRVEDYIRYRPDYPPVIVDLLEQQCGLAQYAVVTDIGAGTGKLAELFLRHGNPVFGVEPNQAMRLAAESLLQGYPNFTSLAGRSEDIPLANASVDFIIAGQAYHWFDPEPTRLEFVRILKPGGWVILAWNERDASAPFLADYEQMLGSLLPDYATVTHKRLDDNILQTQLGLASFHKATFSFKQTFDFASLQGRTLSSSYSPQPGQPGHDALIVALAELFERYQQNGVLDFDYVTNLYYGQFEQLR